MSKIKETILEEINEIEDMLDDKREEEKAEAYSTIVIEADRLFSLEAAKPEDKEVDYAEYFAAGKGVELFVMLKAEDKLTASKIYNKARLDYLKGVDNE